MTCSICDNTGRTIADHPGGGRVLTICECQMPKRAGTIRSVLGSPDHATRDPDDGTPADSLPGETD